MTTPPTPISTSTPTSALIDPAWLAAHAEDPTLRVFDATKYLPNEGKDGAALFARAHIPGAAFFDIDLFADPDTDLPHMAPTAGRFAHLADAAGIRATDTVVFYDQHGQASAARGWWLLRLFGHDRVCLLDGGLPAWRRAGLGLEGSAVGDRAYPPATGYAPRLHARRLCGLGDVHDNLPRNGRPQPALVLDARPPARFAGNAPEPRPGVQPGHIPGSRNLPATVLLAADGRFLPPETLRRLFAHEGADGSRPVIATCGTGVTASTLAFALEHAGLPPASVYDGSWTEWGSRPDTPKALGPAA